MKCIFTGKEVTDSDEHVIPTWLQARFKLADETMFIPNGTTLKYKHHRVPADKEANHAFGKIEHKIANGIFEPSEVYLWALKLHIGCIYRDASLRHDIKDPSSPFILDVSHFEEDVWLFQQLFDIWRNGGSTDPTPLGSVFVLDALHPTSTFDFMHCLITGTVGVSVGDKFIVVFLWDQGDAARSSLLEIWRKWHVPEVGKKRGSDEFADHCYMAHHVWACEGAYGVHRRRRPFSLVKTPSQLTLVPPMSPAVSRPSDEAEYRVVCRNFGLELVTFAGDINNVYRPLSFADKAA